MSAKLYENPWWALENENSVLAFVLLVWPSFKSEETNIWFTDC